MVRIEGAPICGAFCRGNGNQPVHDLDNNRDMAAEQNDNHIVLKNDPGR